MSLTATLHIEEQAHTIMGQFLRIDAQVGLTFSGIALSTTNLAKRARTAMVARTAYDTIQRQRAYARLTDVDEEHLARDLRRLEIELEVLAHSDTGPLRQLAERQ